MSRHWWARFDWRDDRGFAGGGEVVPFGMLVFVSGSLLITNAWAVVDAKFATDAAAREAARTFVEHGAGDVSVEDAEAAAVAAARRVLDAAGAQNGAPQVRVVSELTSGYVRCARVTFEATRRVPAITVPFIGGFGQGVRVRSVHSELIDPFRDGLPGDGQC